MKEIIREHNVSNLFSVKDKVIMIAGSGGLGIHIGKSLMENGACVLFTARNKQKLEKLTNDLLEENFKNFDTFLLDQRDKCQIEEVVGEIEKKYNGIDVLFNTAAIAPNDKAEDFGEELIEDVIDINLVGAIFVTQVVGKAMIKKGGGKIINIGSVAGLICHSYESMPYEAAKAGVHQITKTFATAWGKYNINVNCIAPTWIMTPMLEDESQSYLDAAVKMHEFGRMAYPDDFVGTAIFLASDASNYISGHVLVVDGAWSVAKPIQY